MHIADISLFGVITVIPPKMKGLISFMCTKNINTLLKSKLYTHVLQVICTFCQKFINKVNIKLQIHLLMTCLIGMKVNFL